MVMGVAKELPTPIAVSPLGRDLETAAPSNGLGLTDRKDASALRIKASAELQFVRAITLVSTLLFGVFLWLAADALWRHGWSMLPNVVMMGGLFYCALAFQLIRLGAAKRRVKDDTPVVPARVMGQAAPTLTVLIPSYQESRRVLIETVLSAVLSTYPNKSIVVLLDDPPSQPDPLAESLGAIAEVQGWAREGAVIREEALAAEPSVAGYAQAHDRFADWLLQIAIRLQDEADPSFAHVDGFVRDRVVLDLARRHREAAQELRQAPAPMLGPSRDWIAATASGQITSFQRKSFANLSHAANKAMNLNAYLGLMGQDFAVALTADGRELRPVQTGELVDLSVPMTDYVLTLDADSVILSDYILTMVGILEAKPDAAVAQSPYLTFPHAKQPVERIAGATTDIQYLIHQGSEHYDAAYWVGANAVLRRRALEDIRCTRQERGHEVPIFVQDKTVIEDTGSTIDLADNGWRVHNHFTPLAFSATPADFGALEIQRRRWANGGLIVFGDLIRSQMRNGKLWRDLPQLFVRAHYLLSPLIGNLGILALMLLPVLHVHAVYWAALFMVPYFVLYISDLQRMGYRWSDIFGVCALNLILLPVNLAGVLASILQMIGFPRRKFRRTPKVASRTAIPPYAFLFNLTILGLMLSYVVIGIRENEPLGMIIPLINSLLYSYAIWRFIGISAGFADLGRHIAMRFSPKALAGRLETFFPANPNPPHGLNDWQRSARPTAASCAETPRMTNDPTS